jgi:RDD family
MSAVDPRTIITAESFGVAPELLGLPLARPWRRAVAMAVDLLLVLLLTRTGGFVLALSIAAALWFAASSRGGGLLRRWTRFWVRATAVVVALVAILVAVGAVRSFTRRLLKPAPNATGLAALVAAGSDFRRLRDVRDSAQAQAAAQALIDRLQATGVSTAELSIALDSMTSEDSTPMGLSPAAVGALRRTLDEAVPEPKAATPAVPATLTDSGMVGAYLAALRQGDTARATSLRHDVVASLGADTLASLGRQVDRLEGQRVQLAKQLTQARNGNQGITGFIRAAANDLGVGLGWIGLYFTAFLALWKGQTPGKRLMGVRVLRLDAEPIGWWAAFERFGGYSAGFATGLLGFAQVLWDRNRQAIHDKISETVVVQEGREASRPDGRNSGSH